MSNSRLPRQAKQAEPSRVGDDPLIQAERRMAAVGELVKLLDAEGSAPTFDARWLDQVAENQLVQIRLGIASALYAALRAKDTSTARHSLRVALTCSAWSVALDLPNQQRDSIELACLLHDIGKIGVPDHILLKPAALSADEVAVMRRHQRMGLEVIAACRADEAVMQIVLHKSTWYDGTIPAGSPSGESIPLGARMLAIVDAFDSMISDAIYRPGLSRERAMGELYRVAGTQFDPKLVEQFCELNAADRHKLEADVARRWLLDLDDKEVEKTWHRNRRSVPQGRRAGDLFLGKLLESMRDAVVFVDRRLRIILWNHGAERLTGISAESIQGRQWEPGLLAMRDENGLPLQPMDCPVADAMDSGQPWAKRVIIRGRGGTIPVDAQVTPVVGEDGATRGVTLLLHDISSKISLEERCQSLRRLATLDPLTQVANRAEFDRVLGQFVTVHLEQRLPCSLIICDLDFFKQVNDTYGHQAGDEVLIAFSSLLRSQARAGDLVARYGGEEFVMLCADCGSAAVARRAEQLRSLWAAMPQPVLSSKCVTASFGVTELQPGDTPETMLRRADRALLLAKKNGRNSVVQLGVGLSDRELFTASAEQLQKDVDRLALDSTTPTGLFGFLRRPRTVARPLIERRLVTMVPLSLTIEKLRGFIADHHGEVQSIETGYVKLKIGSGESNVLRRRADRRVPLVIELQFFEGERTDEGSRGQTRVDVVIKPQRGRDRRQADIIAVATQLLVSLRAYLMAIEEQSNIELNSESIKETDLQD